MRTKKKTISPIAEQIKNALDGRTQRWLALQIPLTDVELSNRLKGIIPFSPKEIEKIESVLNIKIQP